MVNNLNLNFKGLKQQLSILYGSKYVLESIDGQSYSPPRGRGWPKTG
ncbi:hypothetical protein GMSM_38930 [Geomonas sp. Red276]